MCWESNKCGAVSHRRGRKVKTNIEMQIVGLEANITPLIKMQNNKMVIFNVAF